MILASHVNKSFSGKKILTDISFHIRGGETVALIGLNGSGKTTLTRILAGTLRADSGYVRVGGEKPWSRQIRQKIRVGIVSAQQSNLHPDRTVKDSIYLCQKMYPDAKSCLDMDYIRQHLGSTKFFDKLKCNLSMGERMRAEFLYAAMLAPHLLIMDEPMIGMDYEARMRVYDCLEYLSKRQTGIDTATLLVTHNIQEMERLCKRVIAIHNGQIIFDGATKDLQRKYLSLGKIYFELEEGTLHFHDMPVKKYKINGKKVHMIYDKRYVSANVILQQLMEKAVIKNIRIPEMDMETIIRNLYLGTAAK